MGVRLYKRRYLARKYCIIAQYAVAESAAWQRMTSLCSGNGMGKTFTHVNDGVNYYSRLSTLVTSFISILSLICIVSDI